ncbi:phosphonate transport system permease protein [Nocardioides albertanoniae]|uniref:Phosphonate transport system permease protein n=1 Tax=Nocardioides albertanoniae TaxID=1175486 RepID=A0A543A9W1_9ACTN|nr:phosphonate ABC transporter, permease protein PhnE [Nocardioides albertanoniae]TQL69290.1 phosphonate transport system permease protein [Nocardioides albertanoniae]
MTTDAKARPKPPPKWPYTVAGLVLIGVVLLAGWSLEDAKWERLPQFPGEILQYAGQMLDGVLTWPGAHPEGQSDPDLTYGDWWLDSLSLMGESVALAWIGTCVGALFSFPLAFLAASNTAPWFVRVPVRTFFNAIRAVPEILLAVIVMLPLFGLNPMAGAMAIGIHSIGSLGKLTLENVEAVDPRPVEAVTAAGASWWQRVRTAVVPQMLPETVAFWLYRFEVNIRASAILGVVSAGGIGALLNRVLRGREWEWGGIMLAVIIIVTIVVDQISAGLRHRILHGTETSMAGAAA